MADLEDYKYPHIEPTDYIDESLKDILARDDAAKHSFRRVSSFPSVTADDVGMKIYLVGQGNFQLVSADPEPKWKQLSDDSRTAAYVDWVRDNYQPISKLLSSLAKLKEAQQAVPYFNGPEDMQAVTVTRYILDLLSQTDAEGVRTILNLGTAAILNTPIEGKYLADGSITMNKVSTSFKQSLGWTTGDIKATFKSSADSGWVMMNDGSIGNSTSGATTRASSDTYNLYTMMWNNPYCTVQTFSGGASTKTTAIQDWASNKRLVLPKMLGRALACAGQGSGLTKRNLGQSLGEESVTLTAKNVPPHSHAGMQAGYQYIGTKNSTYTKFWGSPAGAPGVKDQISLRDDHEAGRWMSRDDYDFSTITDKYGNLMTSSSGETASSISNLQPTTFVNFMIKL